MTNKVPTSYDWDISDLPGDRRGLLDEGASFHEIIHRIVGEAQIVCCWPEPFRDAPAEACGAKQACYRIAVRPESFDLFYNSANGLRAMYWRSPADGDQATKYAVQRLRPMLLQFAMKHPEALASGKIKMEVAEVQQSLDAPSAKIWVREKDDSGDSMISTKGQPQLQVPRWAAKENEPGSKGPLWRWTPIANHLEVKGALIGPDGTEHVPQSKRDRAKQIHRFGFT
jgi:hypothetical protein